MRYYSEKTKKFYNTEKECIEAEDKLIKNETQKAAERKADAEKVETARKALIDARKNFEKALSEFTKKHGAYHVSLKHCEYDDMVDWFINNILF